MDVLNFIPLLAWMLGLIALGVWDDHLRMIDGRENDKPEAGGTLATVWITGTFLWFFIGIWLTIAWA